MYFLLSSVVILSLFANLQSQDPTPFPVQAVIKVTMGEARIFSGEDLQLSCSVPDLPAQSWVYHWYHKDVKVMTSDVFDLKKVEVQQGGSYTCKAAKELDVWPFTLMTLLSEPLSVQVDGGWALLRIPAEPLLIEETLTLTCRVRDEPILVEVIFYKDNVEIRKQTSKDLEIFNITLKNNGKYWCRATWVQGYEYQAAQSLPVFVTVLDKLSTPVVELDESLVFEGDKVVFKCVSELNIKGANLNVVYQFLKNESRLGPFSSHNTHTILMAQEDDAGFYTCKARVRALSLERLSEPKKLTVSKP